MPLYRPPAAGRASGAGVSSEGCEGAQTMFESIKSALGDLGSPLVPSAAAEAASGKAAADAYLACRNGDVPMDLNFQPGSSTNLPEMSLDCSPDAGSLDIGKALNEMMANMGDLLNQALSAGPIGILSQFINFLFKLFSSVVTSISQFLAETARAAAAAIEDALKKQMEMASAAGQGIQPLELFTQSATTQTVSHALKNSTV